MHALALILDGSLASSGNLGLIALVAASALGALAGHRWQARSHRDAQAAGRLTRPVRRTR
jgi:hypothetical protein